MQNVSLQDLTPKFALKFLFSLIGRKLLTRVEKRFTGQRIILQALSANFFGQKSKGVKQIRGKGVLVLTKDELWFSLALPAREISISVKDIKSVKLIKSHLSKTVFRPLLCVEFLFQGIEDSIAWLVNDPEEWKTDIEKVQKKDWSHSNY